VANAAPYPPTCPTRVKKSRLENPIPGYTSLNRIQFSTDKVQSQQALEKKDVRTVTALQQKRREACNQTMQPEPDNRASPTNFMRVPTIV
jgi:hypothetical protein